MKRKFSTKWKSSKRPGKQRKYLAKAPIHIRRKFFSVNLSKELRKKYQLRNIPIRKNDVVKVMKGEFKKKQGKVIRILSKELKIYIEGIQVKKMDGSKADIPFKSSNLQIVELNTEDKKRLKEQKTDSKMEEKSKNKDKTLEVKK